MPFAQSCLTLSPWTVARQALLSVEFSRPEYWSGQPFPSPGDLPNPGVEPRSPVSPALLSHRGHTNILQSVDWVNQGRAINIRHTIAPTVPRLLSLITYMAYHLISSSLVSYYLPLYNLSIPHQVLQGQHTPPFSGSLVKADKTASVFLFSSCRPASESMVITPKLQLWVNGYNPQGAIQVIMKHHYKSNLTLSASNTSTEKQNCDFSICKIKVSTKVFFEM